MTEFDATNYNKRQHKFWCVRAVVLCTFHCSSTVYGFFTPPTHTNLHTFTVLSHLHTSHLSKVEILANGLAGTMNIEVSGKERHLQDFFTLGGLQRGYDVKFPPFYKSSTSEQYTEESLYNTVLLLRDNLFLRNKFKQFKYLSCSSIYVVELFDARKCPRPVRWSCSCR